MQIGDLAWFGKRLGVVIDIDKGSPPANFFSRVTIKLLTGEEITMNSRDLELVDK